MQTKSIHLAVGFFVIAIFLLTGYHMKFHIHELMEANDRFRFSIRGNHIYILLLALLNLSLGTYMKVSQIIWRAYLQLVGSLMILSATGLVIVAFFFEDKSNETRPFTLLAIILALLGTVVHVLGKMREQ
jgi:hypothetical protein